MVTTRRRVAPGTPIHYNLGHASIC
jgi:hypothetical protein